MVTTSKSPLQLDDYVIEEFSFRANQVYDSSKPGSGKLDIEPDLRFHKTDKNKFLLSLCVRYRPDRSDPGGTPYYVKISGKAFLSLAGDMSTEEHQRLVLFNGSAILYGLLRGHVAQFTALGPNGPLLLPVANLVPVLTRHLKRQLARRKNDIETKKDMEKLTSDGARTME